MVLRRTVKHTLNEPRIAAAHLGPAQWRLKLVAPHGGHRHSAALLHNLKSLRIRLPARIRSTRRFSTAAAISSERLLRLLGRREVRQRAVPPAFRRAAGPGRRSREADRSPTSYHSTGARGPHHEYARALKRRFPFGSAMRMTDFRTSRRATN